MAPCPSDPMERTFRLVGKRACWATPDLLYLLTFRNFAARVTSRETRGRTECGTVFARRLSPNIRDVDDLFVRLDRAYGKYKYALARLELARCRISSGYALGFGRLKPYGRNSSKHLREMAARMSPGGSWDVPLLALNQDAREQHLVAIDAALERGRRPYKR